MYKYYLPINTTRVKTRNRKLILPRQCSYFVVQNLAGNDETQVIRYAALLRGTESAWQALSYGLESLTVFAQHGGVYMNFALWGVAVAPAWLVIRHFGSDSEVWTGAASSPLPGGGAESGNDDREETLK